MNLDTWINNLLSRAEKLAVLSNIASAVSASLLCAGNLSMPYNARELAENVLDFKTSRHHFARKGYTCINLV